MENREREFSHDDCKLNVDHMIKDVAAMYRPVRQTAEDNTPDTYLPVAGAGKKLLGQKESAVGGANPKPPSAEEAAGDAAQKIDTMAAAEDAEAGKTAPAETGKAAPAEASPDVKAGTAESSTDAKPGDGDTSKDAKPENREASGTNPSHEDDTEETPLLPKQPK